jgi:hypothetical protein
MDFSFLAGQESNILRITKDCKEFAALSYVAMARSADPARYNFSFLYAFNLDGVDMILSSDGHRMNYAPFVSDTDFTVVKQTKSELVLERIANVHRQMPNFDKVIPRDKDVFHVEPYAVFGWGCSKWKIEFLIDYLYRLSRFQAAFNFSHLSDFIENILPDGRVRILCPRKGPGSAWRIEHLDSGDNLRYGTVFMPLMGFGELDNVKSPYVTGSGFTDYRSAGGSDGNSNG